MRLTITFPMFCSFLPPSSKKTCQSRWSFRTTPGAGNAFAALKDGGRVVTWGRADRHHIVVWGEELIGPLNRTCSEPKCRSFAFSGLLDLFLFKKLVTLNGLFIPELHFWWKMDEHATFCGWVFTQKLCIYGLESEEQHVRSDLRDSSTDSSSQDESLKWLQS